MGGAKAEIEGLVGGAVRPLPRRNLTEKRRKLADRIRKGYVGLNEILQAIYSENEEWLAHDEDLLRLVERGRGGPAAGETLDLVRAYWDASIAVSRLRTSVQKMYVALGRRPKAKGRRAA